MNYIISLLQRCATPRRLQTELLHRGLSTKFHVTLQLVFKLSDTEIQLNKLLWLRPRKQKGMDPNIDSFFESNRKLVNIPPATLGKV